MLWQCSTWSFICYVRSDKPAELPEQSQFPQQTVEQVIFAVALPSALFMIAAELLNTLRFLQFFLVSPHVAPEG